MNYSKVEWLFPEVDFEHIKMQDSIIFDYIGNKALKESLIRESMLEIILKSKSLDWWTKHKISIIEQM